ncbi:Protein of unknown function, partial [Gryllus bimaculatus]
GRDVREADVTSPRIAKRKATDSEQLADAASPGALSQPRAGDVQLSLFVKFRKVSTEARFFPPPHTELWPASPPMQPQRIQSNASSPGPPTHTFPSTADVPAHMSDLSGMHTSNAASVHSPNRTSNNTYNVASNLNSILSVIPVSKLALNPTAFLVVSHTSILRKNTARTTHFNPPNVFGLARPHDYNFPPICISRLPLTHFSGLVPAHTFIVAPIQYITLAPTEPSSFAHAPTSILVPTQRSSLVPAPASSLVPAPASSLAPAPASSLAPAPASSLVPAPASSL